MNTYQFPVDNGKFGRVLTEVMNSRKDITVRALSAFSKMQKERICNVWNGKADYGLSVYVRIVSALRYFFEEEEEYQRVRKRLIEAAFDDSYFRDKE